MLQLQCANDAAVLEGAALGIYNLARRVQPLKPLLKADVAVPDIRSAIELRMFPNRLAATLGAVETIPCLTTGSRFPLWSIP